MKHPSPFKWRHFEAEIILLCVRWYLRYSLSYRDLEEMMAGARTRGRSYHHLPLGAALCPGTGQTLSAASESLQRFLESGRDVHQNPKNLDVSLPGRRLARQHPGVSLECRRAMPRPPNASS